jgi:hypothetical protein
MDAAPHKGFDGFHLGAQAIDIVISMLELAGLKAPDSCRRKRDGYGKSSLFNPHKEENP